MAKRDKKTHPITQAVDLDGTLAEYHGFRGEDVIGAPIPRMVSRVKRWLAEGIPVVIFTARAHEASPEAISAIEDWCEEHLGERLEVTNEKRPDFHIWDDNCVQVLKNQGIPVAEAVSETPPPPRPPKDSVKEKPARRSVLE